MVEHVLKILYGTEAVFLPQKERKKKENTHRWKVYLRGVNPKELQFCISAVEFVLHESFQAPSRKVLKPPFEIIEEGWGEFEILLRIFCDNLTETPLVLTHFLRIYGAERPKNPEDPIVSEFCDEMIISDPPQELLSLKAIYDEKDVDVDCQRRFLEAENKTAELLEKLIQKYQQTE